MSGSLIIIIKDHGGQTASPPIGAEVEINVVLLTEGLAVSSEVVEVDGRKLSHIGHQQLDCPAGNKSEQSSGKLDTLQMFHSSVSFSTSSVKLGSGEKGQKYHDQTEDQGYSSHQHADIRIPAIKQIWIQSKADTCPLNYI